jgi:acetolactate synthase-1/2/3 large subunit
MTLRVADFIASHLRRIGVDSIFLVSGGNMMYLIDALPRVEGLRYYCTHHEQAAAMAAEGYARQTNRLGVCYATSGPGATNILTGLVGAWQDSSPVLFITGQSKRSETIAQSGIPGLRQFGTFEVDIVPMVRTVTKYAAVLNSPDKVRYELEKAISLATSGRPGPVLLDIPLDVQGAVIDPATLEGYSEPPRAPGETQCELEQVFALLTSAQRPLIIAGHGVRCAGAAAKFRKASERLRIPVVTTQLAKDLLPYDNPVFIGHPGVRGDRPGNFAVQTADLVLALGCGLHTQTTGYNPAEFAPRAEKIHIDSDTAVLRRACAKANMQVSWDVGNFLDSVEASAIVVKDRNAVSDWLALCSSWKSRYSVRNEPHELGEPGDSVNFYEFADLLSGLLSGTETVVTDAGSAFYVMGQAFRTMADQRYMVSGAMGSMGYALPASLGAAVGARDRQVICVTGDGSFHTNSQELETIRNYGLTLKVFVIDNDGYASIRNTQKTFFDGHLVGSSRDSGLSLPPLELIARAYRFPYVDCSSRKNLRNAIQETLNTPGPVLCRIEAQPDQKIMPSVISTQSASGVMTSRPLEDMAPFIGRDELNALMESAIGCS